MDLDDFKATVKKTFIHDGFTFEKDKKYFVDQDQHYVCLTDGNDNLHVLTYEEAGKYLYSV